MAVMVWAASLFKFSSFLSCSSRENPASCFTHSKMLPVCLGKVSASLILLADTPFAH